MNSARDPLESTETHFSMKKKKGRETPDVKHRCVSKRILQVRLHVQIWFNLIHELLD